MKPSRIVILLGLLAVAAIAVGFAMKALDQTSSPLPAGGSSSSSAPSSQTRSSAGESAGHVAMPSSYDPMNDPENEGSPAYKAAESESLKNVARVKTIAKAFVFKGVPEQFVEYCPPAAGFCFSYPPSWGKPTWGIVRECIGRDDLIGFAGSIGTGGDDDHYFGATAYSYAKPKECQDAGRGGSVLDWMPNAQNAAKADTTITTANKEKLALWYGYEVGWLTHKYEMAFAAPTQHPLVTRIAFIGPQSSSPDLTKEEIEEFLNVAYSYRSVLVGE